MKDLINTLLLIAVIEGFIIFNIGIIGLIIKCIKEFKDLLK